MSTLHLKQGDTALPYKVQLTYTDGSIVDLTLATAITFTMAIQSRTTVATTGAMTIVGAATLGTVQYVFQPADVANAGTFDAEVVVTFVGGTKLHCPSDGYDTITIEPSKA